MLCPSAYGVQLFLNGHLNVWVEAEASYGMSWQEKDGLYMTGMCLGRTSIPKKQLKRKN